jgi:regulator of protease activity HflC (stomatin/prohibitin superfamily)
VLAPWNHIDGYDLRGQEHDEDIWALTADGAPVEARASLVTCHPIPDQLVQLDREVGTDYYRVLVRPIVRSTVRRVLAGYQASQITSSNILLAQKQITNDAALKLQLVHVVLDSVDLRTMVVRLQGFYDKVLETGAIEQDVLAGPARLELARRRAEAHREDAASIEKAHARIAPTLTARLLRDEARRAEARLLSSPGTTVVVASPGEPVRLEVAP